jgi:heterodisulfide reductase subunit A-like polyferredoxin
MGGLAYYSRPMSDIYYYLLPFAFISLVTYLYWRGKQKRYAAAAEVLDEAIKSGLTEPSSLHPVIDPNLCCGSGACIRACPEKAIGLINHKAVLVNPAHCIGHGACAPVCPVGAVKLVFGTEKRGIDIPHVQPNFETNVPGIYIAGELGGMGLVRKAAEQGRQAMESIAKLRGSAKQLDVVIVGAGPAGLAATLGAMEKKLRSVTLEQEDSLGGTVYHYPRNKLVMTQPVVLPIVGKAKLGEITKEDLLAFWQGIDRKSTRLNSSHNSESRMPSSA